MPTAPAVALALGVLTDAGMLSPLDGDHAEARTRSWHTLLSEDMTDKVLATAVRLLAAGDIEIYGQVKVSDVNRAARRVRSERVRDWRQRHSLPTGRRTPFQQAAYLRGFLRAVGDGLDEVQADRHGRAAMAQAEQVASAEPGTPLSEVLARMDTALNAGRLPWARTLPPARPVAEIGCEPEAATGTETGAARARAVLAALTSTAEPP
ncbi:hypothetical protein [Actinomyces gaoshouyii]|uniref:hypothetical protein n=1 Tax=Actinomyces gaoshouyii TaxID=1960083 RepID=UPI0009C18BF2|nr:hypothetical protein [Actinomyces gaoshouyii]ARD42492.1 hypothetical protein B6G06_09190 [Actinomyces gaoshouyii]